MVEVVWTYGVREEGRAQFELAFGPGGAWSKLVSRAEGFRGTTLLCDTRNQTRYLVLDLWDTEAQASQAKVTHDELLAALAEWVEYTTELGVFSIRAQGTVRPAGKPRRHKG